MIQLTSEWTRRHMAMAVPGAYYNREVGAYVLDEVTPRAAAMALRLFPDLTVAYPELEDERDKLYQDARPFDNATPYDKRIAAERIREQLESFYDFQEIDLGYMVDVLREHRGGYIGWERGLGKTLGACAIATELDAKRVLVVCPNTAKQSVWEAEINQWCPWYKTIVIPNVKKQREYVLDHLRNHQLDDQPIVFIIHYEAMNIVDGGHKGWHKLGKWDLMVMDEAHRIKNIHAKMSKAAKRIPAELRLALSGSIIQNHAEELFSVLQWLFPERYRAKWRDWNDRFLDYIEGGYGKICVGIKSETLDELRRELGVFMVYRRKQDELDLPPKRVQTILVEISGKQRRAYDELLNGYQTILDDGTPIKATDGLVLLTRLRQVASGLDTVGDTVTDSAKMDAALELIEDNEDEPFVVFTWFKATAYSLAAELKKKEVGTYVVTGDTSNTVTREKPESDRSRYIREFQGGSGRVFIGTLATLGESVTLHRASNAIFMDRSWNPALNVQAEDRLHRIGQNNQVLITNLVARDTVDELRVTPALANKEALRRLIFGGE